MLSMGPDDKNVIDESLPDRGCWGVVVNKLVLKPTHEGIGLGRCHSCAHGCSTNLQIMFVIKVKIVFAQD